MYAIEEPVEEETAWTRRLRELSQLVAVDPVPLSVPPIKSENEVAEEEATESESLSELEPVESNSMEAESEDDEFSVEAQLARLLGRLRRVSSDRANAAAEASHDRNSVTSEDSSPELTIPESHSSDRSHLKAEPTHKQNKNAVRDEVQSFREVAQMSARTALAKHSWKNLRSKFYFTLGLTMVSGAAASWYMGAYINGTETDIWKGATCALTTAFCTQQLIWSSSKLNQVRRKNGTRPAANSRPAASSDEPTP